MRGPRLILWVKDILLGQFNLGLNENSNEGIRRGNFFQSVPQTTRNIPHDTGCLPDRLHLQENNKTASRAPKFLFSNRDKSGSNKLCVACWKRGHYVIECPEYKLQKITPGIGVSDSSYGQNNDEKPGKTQ